MPIGNPPLGTSSGSRSYRALCVRAAAGAAVLGLGILSSARFSGASMENVSLPLADVTARGDAVLQGTIRMEGDRLVFYSGTHLTSIDHNVMVHFTSGGMLNLCPHSQIQIVAAGQNSGLLLALDAGGTQQLFPLRVDDEILTPDWRVVLAGNVASGDAGALMLTTNRRGDLCMQGDTQQGAWFQVSQLLGNSSFKVDGSGPVLISGGQMQKISGTCGCDAAPQTTAAAVMSAPLPAPADELPPSAYAGAAAPAATPPATPAPADESAAATARPPHRRQHPRDVAGYMRSFVRVLFGR